MKLRLPAFLLTFVMPAVFCLTLFTTTSVQAEGSPFVNKFLNAKQRNSLMGMQTLIEKNKATLPAEIEQILTKANADNISSIERINLLDLAYQIAKMHQEWNNGDQKTVKELKTILSQYWKNKVAQQKILDSIKQVEDIPGNFVMNAQAEAMNKAELAPVIYPHWVHRSFFRCKVCHENLIIMKRGANALSHETFDSGKLCGACHNGKIAFDATDKALCTRCHLFNSAEAEGLIDLSYYDEAKFTATAARLGGKWHGEHLPDGKFPLSKLGFIDWVKLDELEAYEPLSSLSENAPTEGIRETKILFTMPEKYSFMLDNVLWSHKIHTTWINCSICHEGSTQREKIFEKKAGAAKVSMIEIKEGKSCGTCHGRVSFPIADCKRCHNHKGEEIDSDTLIRHSVKPPPAVTHAEDTTPESDDFF